MGRSEECDLVLEDAAVSSRHCQVSQIEGILQIRDLGSANGTWLNGERTPQAELFDGDLVRLGQTSLRVQVAGGRRRPVACFSPRFMARFAASLVVLSAAGAGLGLALRKRAQHRRDVEAAAGFVAAALEGQRNKPCAAVVDRVLDVARMLGSMGKLDCRKLPRGEEARRTVDTYRDVAGGYGEIVAALNQFARREAASAAVLAAAAEQVRDAEIRAKIAEAQDAIEERSRVTAAFMRDWRLLGEASATYGSQLERVLFEGDAAGCSALERGVRAKEPTEILQTCNRSFDRARGGVEEKLKELLEVSSAGAAE